jgi:hypothetical protein
MGTTGAVAAGRAGTARRYRARLNATASACSQHAGSHMPGAGPAFLAKEPSVAHEIKFSLKGGTGWIALRLIAGWLALPIAGPLLVLGWAIQSKTVIHAGCWLLVGSGELTMSPDDGFRQDHRRYDRDSPVDHGGHRASTAVNPKNVRPPSTPSGVVPPKK